MGVVFFPSCKARASYKESSAKLHAYIEDRLGIRPAGCCRVGHKKLTPADTALVVCNNCAAIVEESSKAGSIEFVWDLIDRDSAFPFPDYGGEAMTLQDCWIAVEKRHVQETVRSLLRKMNISVVELEENYEKTRFCGPNLMAPCSESNALLARHRYVETGAHMFPEAPVPEDEQRVRFHRHCEQIRTEKVVTYCKFCNDAVNMGGKRGFHLLELLFPCPQESGKEQ